MRISMYLYVYNILFRYVSVRYLYHFFCFDLTFDIIWNIYDYDMSHIRMHTCAVCGVVPLCLSNTLWLSRNPLCAVESVVYPGYSKKK